MSSQDVLFHSEVRAAALRVARLALLISVLGFVVSASFGI
jgi:hypothetical protein